MAENVSRSARGTQSQRLEGKDLINVGVYAALSIVLMTAASMIGFFPVLMPALCIVVPIVCGIPTMLFLSKVKKPGMVFLFNLVCGIFLGVTHMGIFPVIAAIITGLGGELIMRSGNYRSSSRMILAYAVMILYVWGNLLPLWTDPNYYANLVPGYGQEYADTLQGVMPLWMCPVMLVGLFVGGLAGGAFGRAMLKKHFEKAGIA